MGSFKSMCAPRGEGGTLKAYENPQEEGGRGKANIHYKTIANGVGDISPYSSLIKEVPNLLIFCLASSISFSGI